ncbi:MAG: hypothetical protein A3H44_02000 [Gammaproteobacteria bacterium RIFCSPLOWO2_02_FULL_57_10]|nr:MAG: hypothetical protein A3H44_02000 [Gammaproteobacteria bacterium RIFCSPLOWO2_02_FULL_57_10]
MFSKKKPVQTLLAASILLAVSGMSGNALAQDTAPEGRERLNPMRGERMMERPRPQRHAPGRLIRNMDTDGDKLISQDEFIAQRTEHYQKQFDHRDIDDDGLLSSDESGPRHPALDPDIDIAEFRACIAENGSNPDLEEDRFSAADSNGDGSLSEEEFFMHLEQRAFDQFARIDADDNGQLTPEELVGNMQDQQTHRRIVRTCLREAGDPFL